MTIQIIFDGDFVVKNKVSLRTMGQTYVGLQKALERAYIATVRGGISKGDTIRDEEWHATEFYLESYQAGSFISIFKEIGPGLKRTIDRLGSCINEPYDVAIEEGDIEHATILKAVSRELQALESPLKYEDALNDERINSRGQYLDKTIANYVVQSLVPLSKSRGENSITYILNGDSSYEFYFDRYIASRFGKASKGVELGPIIEYESYVIKLDSKNKKGTIRHKINNKEATIRFRDVNGYNVATEYLKTDEAGRPSQAMKFVGCSVKELGILDLSVGDVIFIKLAD